jgi:hypothetical protein
MCACGWLVLQSWLLARWAWQKRREPCAETYLATCYICMFMPCMSMSVSAVGGSCGVGCWRPEHGSRRVHQVRIIIFSSNSADKLITVTLTVAVVGSGSKASHPQWSRRYRLTRTACVQYILAASTVSHSVSVGSTPTLYPCTVPAVWPVRRMPREANLDLNMDDIC